MSFSAPAWSWVHSSPLTSSRPVELQLPALRARVIGPAQAVGELETLFPSPIEEGDDGQALSLIEVRPSGDTYDLVRDGAVLWSAAQGAELLPLLEWAVVTTAVEQLGKSHLLFHAGAVALGGSALVLPGASGSGKTTLVAGLAAAGCRYLSDEVAVVDPVASAVYPFPKSLCIKRGARGVLERIYPRLRDAVTYHRFGDEPVWYIPPPHNDWSRMPVLLRLLVLPRYSPGASTTLEPLPRSAAARVLLEQSFNARARGPAAVADVMKLVRQADCYSLTLSELDPAVDLLLSALASCA